MSHPSADRSCRNAVDALLRKHGFKIAMRSGDREAVWERAGYYYLQRLAEETIDPGALADAEYAEFLYSEGW